MQIQEIIRGKKGKLTIRLEGGLSFPIYEKEAAKYRMTEGGTLSDQEWNEICTEILEKRAKRRALYILQRMERTINCVRSCRRTVIRRKSCSVPLIM